jgi:hypothetical protein
LLIDYINNSFQVEEKSLWKAITIIDWAKMFLSDY